MNNFTQLNLTSFKSICLFFYKMKLFLVACWYCRPSVSAGASPSSLWSFRITLKQTTPPQPGSTAWWTAPPCSAVGTDPPSTSGPTWSTAESVSVCSSDRKSGGDPLVLQGGGDVGWNPVLLWSPAQLLVHQLMAALFQHGSPDRSDIRQEVELGGVPLTSWHFWTKVDFNF